MVEQIEFEKTKDDDELEMLLGEIPHATSSLTHLQNLNHHHHLNHQSHDNNNDDDYGYYCSDTMKDMMYGMYHDNPSCSYTQNTSSPSSFSSFFSKHDDHDHDHITKSHMLFKAYTPVLSNSYVKKKFDPVNITKPFSRNLVSESNMSPVFGLQRSYGFPEIQMPENLYSQSGLDRNVSCVRYPLSYQSRIRGLDLAVSDNLYRLQSNGVLESSEDSLINQGESESVNHVRNGSFRGHNKKCNHFHFAGGCENGRFSKGYRSFSTPVRCNTLADVKGYIYMFAKEQNGCRFIQSVFDEENPKHVEMVFDDTIGHVNELMVNPFGNYLMQKLLEVCNEEQRMCILMEVTRDLVHISLNTHG